MQHNPSFQSDAPVAQLDRASAFEAEGREFESLRARHTPKSVSVPNPKSRIKYCDEFGQEGEHCRNTSYVHHRLDLSLTTLSSGSTNDVAGLNRTLVRNVPQPKTEEEIRNIVSRAVITGAKITIAGRRHSMGGQTLYPDSISIDMLRFNGIRSLDIENKILVVESGATWRDIQEFLNPYGLAVLTIQGPNVFTVGGSMSVNAHGWDIRHGPVAASIEWFRLLMVDGSVRRCSRTENADLFHLVLGGYGLFG
jgi:FAD/FMN-containing dehydrogenase